MMNKKAISGIVAMIIGIMIVVAIGAVIFGVVRSTVEDNLDQVDSCGINLIDKLSFNRDYACYDPANNLVIFSINRGDIGLDKIVVSIESETSSAPFEMRAVSEDLGGVLTTYPTGNNPGNHKWLPEREGGKTYIYNDWTGGEVTSIKMAPVIKGEECEIVDTITNIPSCDTTTIWP